MPRSPDLIFSFELRKKAVWATEVLLSIYLSKDTSISVFRLQKQEEYVKRQLPQRGRNFCQSSLFPSPQLCNDLHQNPDIQIFGQSMSALCERWRQSCFEKLHLEHWAAYEVVLHEDPTALLSY